jgi:hypothetical protein
VLDFKKNPWGIGNEGGRRSKKFYSQIEQFQHHLNKYNGNIFLTEGKDLFPSVTSKFFFLPV